MEIKHIDYPARVQSGNINATAATRAIEAAGHRQVKKLADLLTISDFVLSDTGDNTDNDALGQEWYVQEDGKLHQLISWENRKKAEGWIIKPDTTELKGALDKETADRKAADTQLQQNIDTEKTRAEAAEKTLTDNLAKEVIDREAADTTLDNKIDTTKQTIDNYTVNGHKISTSPVLNGGDVKLDNYTISTATGADLDVKPTDTTNQAFGKLAKEIDDTKAEVEKNKIVDTDDIRVDASGDNTKLYEADRPVNADKFISRGYKILRPNIVDGKNILTQEMINEPNTTYVIRYNFDLNAAKITIPANSIIIFESSIHNGVLVISSNDELIGNKNNLENIKIEGNLADNIKIANLLGLNSSFNQLDGTIKPSIELVDCSNVVVRDCNINAENGSGIKIYPKTKNISNINITNNLITSASFGVEIIAHEASFTNTEVTISGNNLYSIIDKDDAKYPSPFSISGRVKAKITNNNCIGKLYCEINSAEVYAVNNFIKVTNVDKIALQLLTEGDNSTGAISNNIIEGDVSISSKDLLVADNIIKSSSGVTIVSSENVKLSNNDIYNYNDTTINLINSSVVSIENNRLYSYDYIQGLTGKRYNLFKLENRDNIDLKLSKIIFNRNYYHSPDALLLFNYYDKNINKDEVYEGELISLDNSRVRSVGLNEDGTLVDKVTII